MRTLDQLIADSPTFAGLPPRHLQLIAGCGHMDHVPAGTPLFAEGAPADRFYLIRTGAVAIEVRAPGAHALVLESLHEGDVAGWSWLFPPHRWHFDGRATVPTSVIAFDGACLRGKCDADHELGYQLMRRFAAAIVERLQASRLQLLDVYGHSVAY
jgi:CRP/FNR family cyclic AMP-dependent transcriptional regulator